MRLLQQAGLDQITSGHCRTMRGLDCMLVYLVTVMQDWHEQGEIVAGWRLAGLTEAGQKELQDDVIDKARQVIHTFG